jgi:hypothetical protein
MRVGLTTEDTEDTEIGILLLPVHFSESLVYSVVPFSPSTHFACAQAC